MKIEQVIDKHCGLVIADETQIHQLLMNLCTNAFHALEDTVGTLGVRLQGVYLANDNEAVTLHGLAPGEYLKLEVSDNGSGIDEKIIGHISDSYFTTKPQGKGTGLGYAVCCETDNRVAFEVFRDNLHDYDLVITDQTMPHLSGSELSIKMMEIRPDIPVILCTGYSSVISEHEAAAIGIRGFVMKPTSMFEIAGIVRKILDATRPTV